MGGSEAFGETRTKHSGLREPQGPGVKEQGTEAHESLQA